MQSKSKYLYLFRELRYIGRGKMWPRDEKCGSLYWVFVITGFVISEFLPMQTAAIFPSPPENTTL